MNTGQATKAESKGGVTGSKVGQVVDPGTYLVRQRETFKTELPPTLMGEELTKQICR
jgi:hypothetical protein